MKSTLSKDGLLQAVDTAKRIKQLERNLDFNISVGYVQQSPLCYLVAYDGPASLHTVYNWLVEVNQQLGVVPETILLSNKNTKISTINPGLDGIFILGTGFIHFYNAPVSMLNMDHFAKHPNHHWVVMEQSEGNLLPLFLNITKVASIFSKTDFNSSSYLKHLRFSNIGLGDSVTSNLTKLNPQPLDPNAVTIDLAQAFGAWNEDFLFDINSININVEKLRQTPPNTSVVKLPLYPSDTNRELRFLLSKLNKGQEIKINAFFREQLIDAPLFAELLFDQSPMHKIEMSSKESNPPFPSIHIVKK